MATKFTELAALSANALLYNSSNDFAGFVGSVAGSLPAWSGTAFVDTVGAKDYRTTNVVGAALVNTTSADAVNTLQFSSIMRFGGSAWISGVATAVNFGFQLLPSTLAIGSGGIRVVYSTDGGITWINTATLFNGGAVNATEILSTTARMFGGDLGSGLGNCAHFWNSGASIPTALHHSNRTDGASNVVTYLSVAKSDGIFTNAATMRLLSAGVLKTAAPSAWSEVAAVFVDGRFWTGKNNIAALNTVGLETTSITLATLGTQVYYSPIISNSGEAWLATAAVSETQSWGLQVRPVAGTVAGSSTSAWYFVNRNGSLGAGTWNNIASLNTSGVFACATHQATGDVAGAVNTTTLTNATPAAGANPATMINVPGAGAAGQVGWIKIYVGTTAYAVPYWAAA